MKKLVFVSLAFILCFISSVSCTKEVYSCDPDVNEWTIANKDYYATASRAEIVSLPIERQRAVYLTLPGQKKLDLWMAKYQTLLASKVYTDAEKQGISELYTFANEDHFVTKSGQKEFNKFAEKWVKKMRDKFGWTEEDFFFAACTWMTKNEIKFAVIESGKSRSRTSIDPVHDDSHGGTGKFNCDCTTDIYCSTFGEGGDCNRKTDACNGTERGCGILGNSECDGACEDRLINI